MAELFMMTDMSSWLERGRAIMVEAFNEEIQTIVQRINEAGTEKVSALLVKLETDDNARALIEADIRAFQDKLRPSASKLRDTAEAIDDRLSPLLKDSRRMLSKSEFSSIKLT